MTQSTRFSSNEKIFNVKDYGAIGDGIIDDTAAFQKAVDASITTQDPATTVRQCLGPLYIPKGVYKVTAPIKITSVQGYKMDGDGYQSIIRGSGTFTNVLDINGVAQGSFRNFHVSGPTSSGQVDACIDYYWDSTKSARSTSGCLFENIWCSGRFVHGFGVSRLSNGAKQVDHTSFLQVTVTGISRSDPTLWQSGFYWGSGAQGNQTDFYMFGSGVANCKYGHYLGSVKDLTWVGGSSGGLEAAFYYAGAQGHIHVSGINFEGTVRLWDSFGATGSPIMVELDNIAYSVDQAAADGYWIRTHAPGSFILRNVHQGNMQPGYVTPLKIYSTPATGKLLLVLDGVQIFEPVKTCLNVNSNVQAFITAYTEVSRADNSVVASTAGPILDTGYIELPFEMAAAPAAPSANAARLFLQDNGAGKTQLAVRFATGAVQIIATEP